MSPAALLLMSLGKQMLLVIRSCAYLGRNLSIMSRRAAEFFVMNVKKDYSDSIGGADEPINVLCICPVCNEGAANVTLQRPDLSKLLVQVRRATAVDQLELLRWLQTKFKA